VCVWKRNPELSSKITPRYSEFMKDWAKKDPKFCAQIHDEYTKLVQMAKEVRYH
jgi:transcriptional repressor NF-X1